MDNKKPMFNVEEDEEIATSFAEENAEKENVLPSKKKKLHPFSIFLIVVDVCAVLCFILFYSHLGISETFKGWYVTSTLGTTTHRYMAYIFYNDEQVEDIVAANTLVMPAGVTDIDQITFVEYGEDVVYENPYEEQILKKDEGNDLYKIFEINENGYAGYICVIYDPKQLDICMASRNYGDYISTIAQNNDAIIAVNAATFVYDSESYYMLPSTNIIANYELKASFDVSGGFIGMNEDGILCLRNGSYSDVKDVGYKWAMQFGPFLIVNGEPANITGNGGWGLEPRTAIGQRKDGIVLLVVIDGRGFNNSLGAGMNDLIDIFTRYGCYNAANLDGGGSTTLVENGVVINSPCHNMQLRERLNVCALCLLPDDED